VAAAAALGNIRDDRSVLALIRALEDPALSVREAAKAALEATLGEEFDMNLSTTPGAGKDERVDQLKEWWRSGRVEARTERAKIPNFDGGPPKTEPKAARAAAPEPAAATPGIAADDALAGLEALGAAPVDEAAAEPAGVDGLGANDALTGLESLGVSTASEPAGEPEAEAGGLDDGDGLVGLESLGVIGADEPIGAQADAAGEAAGGLDSGLDGGVEDLGLGGLDVRATTAEGDEKKPKKDEKKPKEEERAQVKKDDKGSKREEDKSK
jgi:hypothetical protein